MLLLVILDLNGTLGFRYGPKEGRKRNKFAARPQLQRLLKYLFLHHKVMVWASATAVTVHDLCMQIFDNDQRQRLVSIWARDKLDLPIEQQKKKAQAYKQLSKVWRDEVIQESALPSKPWNHTNTVLVDDCALKAAYEPYNLIQVDKFGSSYEQTSKVEEIQNIMDYLELLRIESNVANFMLLHPFGRARANVSARSASDRNEDRNNHALTELSHNPS